MPYIIWKEGNGILRYH